MLKDIFIKTVEQRILSLFVANPDKVFYSREISKKIKTSLGATSNALRLLEKNNIFTSEWMRFGKNDPEFFGEINQGITLWEKPINESGF